jgi:hypothetical protein
LTKKTIVFLFILILTPVIIYLIWPSNESRIKKLFKEGSQAIEQQDLETVMSKVSFNYCDEYGLTYLYLKELIKSVFQQMDDIKVEYENVKIAVHNDTATAHMDVLILATIGNDTGYIMGDLTEPAHLTFTLDKEKTKWFVIKTEGLPFNF